MKISQFKKLINEEIRTVLKEQEASDAMAAIEHIKAAVKDLSGSTIAQEDAVLQHLMAKYTGLLGKITSYIKTKYKVEDEPVDDTQQDVSPEASGQRQVPKTQPSKQHAPVKKAPSTPTSGAPDYSKSV